MMRPVVLTLAICVGAAVLEGLMAGRGVRQHFAQLRVPRWSPSLAVWSAIGVAYYLILGFVLYRLFLQSPSQQRTLALSLVVVVLIANAVWNYLFFRARRLGHSLALSAVYSLVALGLLGLLTRLDRVAVWSILGYVAYLPYANWWGYVVWRANQSSTARL